MPVAQGGPAPARQAITVGVAVVLGLLAMVFLVTRFDRLAGGSDTQIPVGATAYTVGQTSELAPAIEETGPLLLPGPTGSGRDLWLQHVGDDPDEGWRAFSVRADGAELGCVTEWRAAEADFVDRCDDTIYPADGQGLVQYPISVTDDGDLILGLDPIEDPDADSETSPEPDSDQGT